MKKAFSRNVDECIVEMHDIMIECLFSSKPP
jgi:hypothetical protein